MNMDYREPRNGDFASYVEELSRHFDMKAQAVNPDFSSRFPSGSDSDMTRKSQNAAVAGSARTTTAVASTKGKASRTGNQSWTKGGQSAEQSNLISLSNAEQQDVKAPTAATTKPGSRKFFSWPLLALIVAGFIFLAPILNPHHNDMDARRNIGALVLQIVIVIYLIKYIRQVARFFSNLFSTSDKPKKHT